MPLLPTVSGNPDGPNCLARGRKTLASAPAARATSCAMLSRPAAAAGHPGGAAIAGNLHRIRRRCLGATTGIGCRHYASDRLTRVVGRNDVGIAARAADGGAVAFPVVGIPGWLALPVAHRAGERLADSAIAAEVRHIDIDRRPWLWRAARAALR